MGSAAKACVQGLAYKLRCRKDENHGEYQAQINSKELSYDETKADER